MTITPESICRLLNELVAIDPVAAHALCETRVPCKKEIEDHPTLIPYAETDAGPLVIGLLGVVNGIAGQDNARIVAHYTDGPPPVLIRFCVVDLD